MRPAFTSHTTVANLLGAGAGVLVLLAGLAANPVHPKGIDPCGGATLQVVSSNEPGKYHVDPQSRPTGVVHDVAARFGTCIKVRAVSSGVEEQVLETEWAGHAGQDTPEVWLPADSLWANLLDRRLPDGGPRPTPLLGIASSPMTVAVTHDKARELGWSEGNLPTWGMVRQAARSGRLRLLKENATNSTSGALATLLAYRAGTGGQGLTAAQVVQGPAHDFAADIEHAVVWYPSDNVPYLKELAARGSQVLRGADAMIVQKALFAQIPGLGHRLVALPVRGETARMDHPFVLRPGLDSSKTRLAKAFHAALRDEVSRTAFRAQHYDEPAAPGGDQSFRDGEVVDAVLDNWAERLRRRVRMVLLLDESGSLRGSLGQVQNALGPALRRLNQNDRVAIAGFPTADGHAVDPLTGRDSLTQRLSFRSPTTVAEDLPRLQTLVVADRQTSPIVEAVGAVRAQLASEADQQDPDNPEVNVIVVLTDGKQDPPSKPGEDATVDALRSSRDLVHVYAIPVGAPAPLGTVSAMAAASNGKVLCVDTRPGCPRTPYRGFDAAFDAIVVELGGNALP
jgi:hypothetical protein